MDGPFDPQGNVVSKDKVGHGIDAPGLVDGYENPVDKEAHRKALLRLDCILLPALTVIYFLNFLDR